MVILSGFLWHSENWYPLCHRGPEVVFLHKIVRAFELVKDTHHVIFTPKESEKNIARHPKSVEHLLDNDCESNNRRCCNFMTADAGDVGDTGDAED